MSELNPITPGRVFAAAAQRGWMLSHDTEQNVLLASIDGVTTVIPTDFSEHFTVVTLASDLNVPVERKADIVDFALDFHSRTYFGTIGVHELDDSYLRVGCSTTMPAAAGATDEQLDHWLEVCVACCAQGVREVVEALNLSEYKA